MVDEPVCNQPVLKIVYVCVEQRNAKIRFPADFHGVAEQLLAVSNQTWNLSGTFLMYKRRSLSKALLPNLDHIRYVSGNEECQASMSPRTALISILNYGVLFI